MENSRSMSSLDGVLFCVIAIASAGFVIILALAAYWDHSIVVLHVLQSLQYVAIVFLAARQNRWAYLYAIAVGTFWNYLALFVNSFVMSGWRALEKTIESGGSITKPDQIIAVFAFALHVILIVAAVAAYFRLSTRKTGDLGALLACFIGAVCYFATIVALSQPRYLSLFPNMLHPHGFPS
jgi:hypothetical protein